MPLLRLLVLLSLLSSIASFVLYIVTSQERYRALGLRILKWTVLAGVGFFAVLILERVL